MPGLLKVGYTTRNLTERINELSSSGIPKQFSLEFFCEVDFAKKLEGKVHHSLRSFHYGKEFFKCTVQDAVKVAKLQLHSGEFCVYGIGGQSKNAFLTDAESLAIVKQKKLKDEELKKKEFEQNLIKTMSLKFFELSLPAEMAIKKYCSLGKHDGLKFLAELAVGITAPLHLGSGFLLRDKFLPDCFEDGKRVAGKMTQSEKEIIFELFEVIKFLKNNKVWHEVTQKNYMTNKGSYLIRWRGSNHDESDLLRGVFFGLGLITSSY